MVDTMVLKDTVEKAIEQSNGILYLRPCWVARDFLPPGKRLGLKDEQYDMGERGFITERWFGAENTADNAVGPADEGLAYLDIEGEDILLKDAIASCGPTIMGEAYAKTHKTLGRLPKIFDYTCRTFFHFHQMEEDANKVGMKGKDEAYYFLEGEGVGAQPDTYFGVHPYIVEQNKQNEIFLPYLKNWARSASIIPIGPGPRINTDPPCGTGDNSRQLSAQERGSVKAAASSETFSGTLTTHPAANTSFSTLIRSANPPSQ